MARPGGDFYHTFEVHLLNSKIHSYNVSERGMVLNQFHNVEDSPRRQSLGEIK